MTTTEPARLSLVRAVDHDLRLDAAIIAADLPDDPEARIVCTWARVMTETWWGSEGPDPGGDPLVVKQGPEGATALIAGRRIPALIVGDVVHLGIPDRLGDCIRWALTACERLLRQPGAENVTLVLGRCSGECDQSWAEWQDADGRWLVSDLTLDDAEPFDRDAFMRALHGTVGVRLPCPDRETLDEWRGAIELSSLAGAIRLRRERISAGMTGREGVRTWDGL